MLLLLMPSKTKLRWASATIYLRPFLKDGCNLVDETLLQSDSRVLARIRYKTTAVEATATYANGILRLVFDKPVWGVTPGQSLVLYRNNRLLGGGFIR